MYSALHFNTMHCTQRPVTLVPRSVCTMIFTPGEFATKVLQIQRQLLGKKHAFFSAFPQTDAIFGLVVSFIWKDFDGAWCVDPPFLEEHPQSCGCNRRSMA